MPRLNILALAVLFVAVAARADFPRKKLIELGWDQPNTGQLRQYHAQMQATAPFDGVVMVVSFKAEGRAFDEDLLDAVPWQRDWLTVPLADLQACRFTRFTDNFIRVNCTPGTVAWEDDAGWAAVAAKLGHLAWLARQSGARGFCFDPESYGARLFRWDPDRIATFAQAQALARKRGVQVMADVVREYPDITFLSLWMLSLNRAQAATDEPDAALQTTDYGLWPAFVNGLLDAAAPQTRFVDGCEFGYYQDDRLGYLELYQSMLCTQGAQMRLIAPENRARYNAQVTAGFGFYLDRYANPEGAKYYIAPLPGGTRVQRLRANLRAALDVADEYVWVYGEQCRWWPTGGRFDAMVKDSSGQGRLWEDMLPGITAAIEMVRDPAAMAARAAEHRNPQSNLVRNPGMDADPAVVLPADAAPKASDWTQSAIPGYHQWQNEGSAGAFTWDRAAGMARIQGCGDGCLIQQVAVRPGEELLVEAQGDGRGSRTVTARWQTPEGRWTALSADVTLSLRPTSAGQPELARGLATVPPGAGYLVLLLSVQGQRPSESCRFDNVGVYRVAELLVGP